MKSPSMVDMRKLAYVLALLLVAGVANSCRMLENLASNSSAGTVDNLWPDVPPFEGATKATLEIPLGARLAIRAMMQGKISFIAFTTTKSAQDVQEFYTNGRMKAAGWTPSEKGCVSDSENEKSKGAVCLYSRKSADKPEGLAIVVAQDEKTKQTEIFYVRADMTEPSPSPTPR